MVDLKTIETQGAYPMVIQDANHGFQYNLGMDVLTVVATAAMEAILSNPGLMNNVEGYKYGSVAKDAVGFAKALISEIEKSK